MNPIASAMFYDTWRGWQLAYLYRYRTTRRNVTAYAYRWQQVNGQGCGWQPATNPAALVGRACLSGVFKDVAVSLTARELFESLEGRMRA